MSFNFKRNLYHICRLSFSNKLYVVLFNIKRHMNTRVIFKCLHMILMFGRWKNRKYVTSRPDGSGLGWSCREVRIDVWK